MTTQEHLQKIKAKCKELLAIAKKRTPGKWKNTKPNSGRFQISGVQGKQVCAMRNHNEQTDADATFISSCAGPAEAGWRATIAAIDDMLHYRTLHSDTEMERNIIAAWPEELL